MFVNVSVWWICFEEHFSIRPLPQEAIVSAVPIGTRYEGSSIEVWMFDDRLEIQVRANLWSQ